MPCPVVPFPEYDIADSADMALPPSTFIDEKICYENLVSELYYLDPTSQLPQDCHMSLCLNSYGTLYSDCISNSYIAQEHVSAEANVYLVLMYVLDIHDFNPTW